MTKIVKKFEVNRSITDVATSEYHCGLSTEENIIPWTKRVEKSKFGLNRNFSFSLLFREHV